MSNLPITHQQALETLRNNQSPEALAILNYVKMIEDKNIAVLGTDQAFILEDSSGQIKAFKKSLVLSVQNGTLIKPTYDGPLVISAQGYEYWAEGTGTSVIFPKEVLVGNEWKPNPYAERDPKNRRILAVHARAIAFRYSSMGIPQISDWTTIFDTPSYRMIDLLAKAKQYPQAFKVLPVDMKPEIAKNETWAHYPFDESMNLWINTSHNEVIKWLSQILNREKKAMDFAQTFAKRNSLKHISGLQKAPCDNWQIPVLAWRPTGNNIIKWDATQYANLQNRVAGMIEGAGSDFENNQKIDVLKGIERTSEDEDFDSVAAEVDPEDNQESNSKPEEKKQPEKELSKDVKQALYLLEQFPKEFKKACEFHKVIVPVVEFNNETAIKICRKISELVDQQ